MTTPIFTNYPDSTDSGTEHSLCNSKLLSSVSICSCTTDSPDARTHSANPSPTQSVYLWALEKNMAICKNKHGIFPQSETHVIHPLICHYFRQQKLQDLWSGAQRAGKGGRGGGCQWHHTCQVKNNCIFFLVWIFMLIFRVNDKRAAKTHAIRNFPALSLFKTGEALHYEGDLTDADAILDFLSSPEALDVPGQVINFL